MLKRGGGPIRYIQCSEIWIGMSGVNKGHPINHKHTNYGYKRATNLGAFSSAISLWAVIGTPTNFLSMAQLFWFLEALFFRDRCSFIFCPDMK